MDSPPRFAPLAGKFSAGLRRWALTLSIVVFVSLLAFLLSGFWQLEREALGQWTEGNVRRAREKSEKVSAQIRGEFARLEGLRLAAGLDSATWNFGEWAEGLLQNQSYKSFAANLEQPGGRQRTVWYRENGTLTSTTEWISREEDSETYRALRQFPRRILLEPYEDRAYTDRDIVLSIALPMLTAGDSLAALVVLDYSLESFFRTVEAEEAGTWLITEGKDSTQYASADTILGRGELQPGWVLLENELPDMDSVTLEEGSMWMGADRGIAFTEIDLEKGTDATGQWYLAEVVDRTVRPGWKAWSVRTGWLIGMILVLFGLLMFWFRAASRESNRLRAIGQIAGIFSQESLHEANMSQVAGVVGDLIPLDTLAIAVVHPQRHALAFPIVVENGRLIYQPDQEGTPIQVDLLDPETSSLPSRICLETRHPVHLPDFSAYLTQHSDQVVVGDQPRSALFVPLFAEPGNPHSPVIGVVTAQTVRQSHRYTRSEAEFLARVGTLTVLALRKEEARTDLNETLQVRNLLYGLLIHHMKSLFMPIRSQFSHLPSAQQADPALRSILAATHQLENVFGLVVPWMQAELTHVPLKYSREDLHRQVKKVLETFGSNAAQRGLEVRNEVPRGTFAFIDPQLFQLILGNVVMNAIKFTPAGGEVDIGAREDGAMTEVWVQDSGQGMAPEELGRLFSLAHAERESTGGAAGLGIGLYISNQLLERMEGYFLKTESTVGQGTTFRFRVRTR